MAIFWTNLSLHVYRLCFWCAECAECDISTWLVAIQFFRKIKTTFWLYIPVLPLYSTSSLYDGNSFTTSFSKDCAQFSHCSMQFTKLPSYFLNVNEITVMHLTTAVKAFFSICSSYGINLLIYTSNQNLDSATISHKWKIWRKMLTNILNGDPYLKKFPSSLS